MAPICNSTRGCPDDWRSKLFSFFMSRNTQSQMLHYFNLRYYLDNYHINIKPCNSFRHYLRFGWKVGLNPCQYFDVNYYLEINPDVKEAGIEPLSHYLNYGWKEGRNPSPYFDIKYYLEVNRDVVDLGVEPLRHYLEYGWKEGRKPCPYFDVTYYLCSNNYVKEMNIEPLGHYLESGWQKGCNPNPFFDVNYYLQKNNPESHDKEPLHAYITNGWREGRSPSEKFDTLFYIAANEDVRKLGIEPLKHYLLIGYHENRQINTYSFEKVAPYPFTSRKLTELTLPLVNSIQELEEYGSDCRSEVSQFEVISNADDIFITDLVPLENNLNAPIGADPCQWVRNAVNEDSIDVSLLHNVVLFGGEINKRYAGYHSVGQLLLTNSGGLIKSSFGLMDGAKTVPLELVFAENDTNYTYLGSSIKHYYDGSLILLGNLHKHFGHFILEGLARVYITLHADLPKADYKFAVYEQSLADWGYWLLEQCGISKAQIYHVPYEGVICSRIIVADSAMKTHDAISPLQRMAWDKIAASAEINEKYPPKVYLSRSKVGGRRLLNENEVEAFFLANGYSVIHPEEYNIAEQINIAANAKSLAGPVGSQMYLAAFQRDGGRNLIFAPANFYLKDDLLIATVKQHLLKVILGSPFDFNESSNQDLGWNIDMESLAQSFNQYYSDL